MGFFTTGFATGFDLTGLTIYEFMSEEVEEAANYTDACFGLGDDILRGDWRSMLNLNVFGWLLLLRVLF